MPIREPRTFTHTRADGTTYQRTYDCAVYDDPAEFSERYGSSPVTPPGPIDVLASTILLIAVIWAG